MASEDNEDIINEKLNELREKAKDKFSEEEIDKFINMGRRLASKSVLSAIVCILREGPGKGFSEVESKSLIKKVEKLMPYKDSGYVSIAFNEIPYTLVVCLSLADREYKTEVMIPSPNYTNDLYNQYNFLKQIAVAYWKQFCQEQPDLIKLIANYRKDIDFSDLIVDKTNPTSLYFDPECKKRISLFCYYLSPDGKPYYKKT